MFRHAAIRFGALAFAGIGLLLVAGPASAQQGWPMNGSNWSYYGGSRGTSSYAPSYYPAPATSYSSYSYRPAYEEYYNGGIANGGVPSAGYYYGAYVPTQNNTAHIRLVVPTDAKVWFGDAATKQGGAIRDFESPALAPGREYVYDVKLRWRDRDGQEVTRTRQLTVSANGYVSVDLTRR
jgi:uncharacterized protein (TIGR03000 family)